MGLWMYWLLMACLTLAAMDLGLVAAFFCRQELELRAKRRRAKLYGFDIPGSYPKWKIDKEGASSDMFKFPDGSSIKFKKKPRKGGRR